MARINLEKVIERLGDELKASLKSALNLVAPDSNIDIHILFKEFKKQVSKNCKQWEHIENTAVDVD
jgi:L-rhamnose isomerase